MVKRKPCPICGLQMNQVTKDKGKPYIPTLRNLKWDWAWWCPGCGTKWDRRLSKRKILDYDPSRIRRA